MIFGYTPIGEYALAELPNELSIEFTDVFAGDFGDAERDFIIVARINAITAGNPYPYSLGEYAIGELDDNILNERIHIASDLFDLDQSEIPDGRWYWRRISEVEITQQIGEPMQSSVMSMIGRIEIANADKVLNSLLVGRKVEGQPVTLFIGYAGLAFSAFRILLEGVIRFVEYSPQRIALTLLDHSEKFEATLQPDNYSGTGGLNGGSDLKGQPLPVAFGEVRNATPVIVDAANRIYQVHHRTIDSVTAVRTNGIAWTFATDTTDIEAWTPVNDQYATDLSKGLIRLGSPSAKPDSTPTIDFTGDAEGGYISQVREIIKRIAVDYAGFDSSLIEAWAGTTPDVGIFITDTQTCAEAMQELCMTGDLFYSFKSGGLLQILPHPDPRATDADITYVDSDIERYAIERYEAMPPVWKYRWLYNRNWTQQNPDSLDSSATLANRRAYQTDGDHSAIGNDVVLGWTPLAKDIEIETYQTNEELDAWRDRLRRDSQQRAYLQLTIRRHLHNIEPGQVINYAADRFDGDMVFRGEVLSLTKSFVQRQDQLTVLTYDG